MNYVIDHIPRNTPCNRRSGNAMSATTITLHNTGNPTSTARNERGWLTNPSNNVTASYHIVVDEREAIECLPLMEHAWHAGDGNGQGNRASIGIEICESGNYTKTLANAAQLVATMLRERGWGVDRLRRHFDWSGKICPHLMYDGGKWTGWTAFKNMVNAQLKTKEGEGLPKIIKERIYASGGKLIQANDYDTPATDVRFIKLEHGKFKTRLVNVTGATVSQLVKLHKADLGINFAFFDREHKYLYGDLVIDGVHRRDASGDYRVNFGSKNGKLVIEKNANIKTGWDWVTSAGPLLLEPVNGKPSLCYAYYRNLQKTLLDIANAADTVRKQRTFVGVDAEGNLMIGIADGLTKFDRGLNLEEMALYMQSKGAMWALNGDGGGSTIIADQTGGLNQAENVGANERVVHHALLIWFEGEQQGQAYKDSDVMTYGDLKYLGLI